MSTDRIERLERALWEIEQLASELDDMGYGTFAGEIYDIIDKLEKEVEQ